tara:strand:+ start:977 stop:1480 length:504 start_codon:yes stop_codon:yes gene_type:complete
MADMSKLLPQEQEAVDMAGQMDQAMNESLMASSPAGDFNKASLNGLVGALNKVLPLFDVKDKYPKFEEGIEDGRLPGEFIRQLSMVAAAAEDSGLLEEPMDLNELTDDQGLRMFAAKMQSLSKNIEFKQFLKEDAPVQAPEEEPVLEEPVAAPMPEMGMDELMMQRL